MRHGLIANLHGARTERRRGGEAAAIAVVEVEEHVTDVNRITDAHAGDDANGMVDRIANPRPAGAKMITGDPERFGAHRDDVPRARRGDGGP